MAPSPLFRAASAGMGIAVCVAVLLSVDRGFIDSRRSSGHESGQETDETGKKALDAIRKADGFFREGKWALARAAYDQALPLANNALSSEAESAKERGIECSLKLKDFEDALRRAKSLQPEPPEGDRSEHRRYYWPGPGETVEPTPYAEVERLEKLGHALELIARELPPHGQEQVAGKLTKARIAADFDSLQILDPDVITEPSDWGWSTRYPEMQWWVNALKGRGENNRGDPDEWAVEWESIPLAADGKPVVLPVPEKYAPNLSRPAKVLFRLDQVERLDSSPNRDDFARAQLHRADIVRRLYGPTLDDGWRGGEFSYRMYKRPTFHKKRGRRDLKEFWQLADDEARTLFAGRLRVVTLPPSQSPLAIWSRIEKECPNSKAVPEAIYQRGLYFQNRRQFSKAESEYCRLIARFPQHNRARSAQKQIDVIDRANVLLGSTGSYVSGSKPKLWFACRQTEKVDFVARRFDFKGYVENRLQADALWRITYLKTPFFDEHEDPEQLQIRARFVGPQIAKWSESTRHNERVSTQTTLAPLPEIGTYLVEARVPNSKEFSSALVIVSDVAIVKKPLPKKLLLWAVNARSGQPLAEQKVDAYFEVRHHGKDRTEEKTIHVTDHDGMLTLDSPSYFYNFAVLATGEHGFCICPLEQSIYGETDRLSKEASGVTDRPVYRPNSTVQFRVWVRELADRQYRPAPAGLKLRLHLLGPHDVQQGESVATLERTTDDSGSVTGSFQLNSEAALGDYHVCVDDFAPSRYEAACQFTVEEYKKPEFEVTVQPPKAPSRLGDVITARVTARYYFGTPVAKGRVHYQITRRPYRVRYAMPSQWDWLYGNGFGNDQYEDAWFDGADMQEEGTEEGDEEPDSRGDEMVSSGTAELNAVGSVDLRIHTGDDPRDSDQQYSISVSVRDEARHTVEANGIVLATRQASYAFAELDGGWYEPGKPAVLNLSGRSVQDQPVDLEGNLILSRIADDVGKADRKVIGAWQVRTRDSGHIRFPFQAGDEGQYLWTFEARDPWKQPVRASVRFWVHSPKLDARTFRGAGLDVIPDRRWYEPGQTARLLVHTAHPNVRLLLWDSFQHYWFVDVRGRADVIEIPLLDKHVPNYFLQATYVADGEMHTENCELFVPPVKDVVNIELRPDQTVCQPGEKGHIHIRALDALGKPVSGTITLTAYDKALTYLQHEVSDGPKTFLVKRKTDFWFPEVMSTLDPKQFSVTGTFVCPEYHLDEATMPPMGDMGGAAAPPDDPSQGPSRPAGKSKSKERVDASPQIRPVAEIRQNFSDTAAWIPTLSLDKNGTADAEIVYPDSTTTWRICGYLATKETHVGESTSEVITSKQFLVRLQTPRFAVEHDSRTLSANVHNNLNAKKEVTAELIVSAARFETLRLGKHPIAPDKEGNLHLAAQAFVAPHSEHRFDWPVKARGDGVATITVQAVCDQAADAMRLKFPILPQGSAESVAQAGLSVANNTQPDVFSFDLPPQIDPAKTRIDISLAPSASASIFDAIPFLAGYPYGCVEQTMSRFYPTVIAVDALQKLRLDLKTLAEHAGQSTRSKYHRQPGSPVLDQAELDRMTRSGLDRLSKFQHDDGGWGWWEHDESNPYMTAYVLLGLDTAAGAGVKIDQRAYGRGVDFLYQAIGRWAGKDNATREQEVRALVCYALSLERSQQKQATGKVDSRIQPQSRTLNRELVRAYAERAKLNVYGRALLALALHNRKESEKAKAVLGESLRTVTLDKPRGLAWIETSRVDWWHWYNSDIETNAWVLRALAAIDPKNPLTAQVANWLSAKRIHGSYWHSTRDTAQAVHALVEYMRVGADHAVEFTVDVALDGRSVTEARVRWDKSQMTASRITLEGKELRPGRHQVTLTKRQRGWLYYSITAQYFDPTERFEKTGRGIHVDRHYFRSADSTVAGVLPYPASRISGRARAPLKDGDSLKVGDILEVELTISSDADYDYIAFEDPKPAGFEPVELHSGYAWGEGLCANVELRDENIVFFSPRVSGGGHVLSYRLRAETPGSFHSRPTRAFDMYNPEIQAHSSSIRVDVRD